MSEQLRAAILLELEHWYRDDPGKIPEEQDLLDDLPTEDLREVRRNFESLEGWVGEVLRRHWRRLLIPHAR